MTHSLADLQIRLEECPQDQRLTFMKGYLAGVDDPQSKAAITAAIGIYGLSIPKQLHVVLMIHGIRTFAEWQEDLRDMLEETPGMKGYPIGYEFFDAVRFWLPFTRRAPTNRVLRHIRTTIGKHGSDKISIVAHSFGTYILSRILAEEAGIKFSRILLCGSVVPSTYKWDAVADLPSREGFLNEVGWKDMWPILAKATSWGYGSSGSFGFKCPSIFDRFHNFGHSDFFVGDHMRRYWLPFLIDGKVMPSPSNKRTARAYLTVAMTWVPLKTLIGSAIIYALYSRYWSAVRVYLAALLASQ